ncbi:hypothetical protein N869_09050 [Cellulomonas bogoriensis 69B4 = DSM 16987]|uniref:Chemotaxis phosphatase CheX-like domain-containing protein n=2 Tax=Cellulomonas bogoriensis TaxID=301388 RepID=A0A0A0C0V2_9CELL|nr:hypothetical protein N869_09050 [Cellulomonas bogoriensis 69B4 = DSM 16987]
MDIDIQAFAGADPILAIAEEVFTAMIDGEPGHVLPALSAPELGDPMHAWVDVQGTTSGRVLLSTERATADDLARALLGMEPDEEVSTEDFVDALGEVANVVGGNVKALVPDPGVLTLPQVTQERPPTQDGSQIYELNLDWRGRAVVISLWKLP